MAGIVNTLSDIASSRLVRVGVCTIGACTVSAPLFVTLGVVYAFWDRKKLTHELTVLFFKTWYTFPTIEAYGRVTEGEWIYFKNREVFPMYIPRFVEGATFLDPIAEYRGAKIFLGAFPHKSHAEWLRDHSCQVIISLVENHEYDVPRCIGKIMRSNEWQDMGFEFHQISSPDHAPLSQETLDRATRVACTALASGKSIYVHCRAGKGRSPLVVAGTLVKLARKSAEEALEIVQQGRPQVSINLGQKARFLEHYARR